VAKVFRARAFGYSLVFAKHRHDSLRSDKQIQPRRAYDIGTRGVERLVAGAMSRRRVVSHRSLGSVHRSTKRVYTVGRPETNTLVPVNSDAKDPDNPPEGFLTASAIA